MLNARLAVGTVALLIATGSFSRPAPPTVTIECSPRGMQVAITSYQATNSDRVSIEWGDGLTYPFANGSMEGQHEYAKPGTYTVAITVSDKIGKGSDTCTVTVPGSTTG